MTILFICTAYALLVAGLHFSVSGLGNGRLTREPGDLRRTAFGLALIAVAMWLVWEAGAA